MANMFHNNNLSLHRKSFEIELDHVFSEALFPCFRQSFYMIARLYIIQTKPYNCKDNNNFLKKL